MALPALPHRLHSLPALPASRAHQPQLSAAVRRVRRAWPVAALAMAVLFSHAWLASLLSGDPPRAGLPRAVAVQLRALPPAVPPLLPVPPDATAAPDAAAAVARPAAAMPRPPRRLPDGAKVAMAPEPVPPGRPAALEGADLPPSAAPTAAPTTAPTTAPTSPQPASPADADVAAGPQDGEPPPLYPIRLPPPVQLRYALQYNGRSGEAVLTWQHDGSRYRLTLDGSTAAGQPLVAQASEGTIDSHGLVPDRFTDRRGTGRLRAANFRHDIGRIGYSGAPQQHPAWPGAQDRLSWLAQLAAILAADHEPPPAAAQPSPGAPAAETPTATATADLRLFVTDALGHAGLWQFQRQPDVSGPSPWGDGPQQHWQRTPPRPEGLRIDIWLAAPAQPGGPAVTEPAGTWPLRLRFAVPRSGDVFALQLLAAP